MSIIDFCKKNRIPGVISQVLISIIALVVVTVEGFVGFIILMAYYFPGPKYGPPPSVDPTPVPDQGLLGGALTTTEGIIGVLVIIASLALYAWAVLGWVFWGTIWYLKNKEKIE
ncbi:hypothetical protein CUJ83_10935 [Methanocella sp. CWC-04]|uniref:Uncharacterized protein n=1 Tax=Methanooceanicella nereidis TaxID=2052831 RepID=A0AAP2W7S3_9EURY|nr:hypothetical protein [Methanocella sp. CWC-04]MCD1295514.1 hypothetical protein [Methanocella sp. CWC-04]